MSQDLSNIISQAVAAKLSREFIEKEVDTRIGKLVVEVVDRSFRSYSDLGKMIEEAVQEALKVDRLDLPSYGQTVTAILKTQIENNVSDLVAGRLSADMQELLNLAPKTIKLSEIAELMMKHHDEDAWGPLITVIVERTRYDSVWLYLDESEHRPYSDKFLCQHRLLLNKDGTIASATISNMDTKSVTHIGRSYGIDQKLRAYIACGTIIELDEDFVVTSRGDY